MKIVLLSGKAGHGKDTAAGFLKDALEADGYRVLITHYADLLKYICRTFFGWNGEKDEAGRQILQYVGTDVVRKKDPDYWVNFVLNLLHLFPGEWDYVLIPDCRFPNELEKVRSSGFDSVHIRVERPDYVSPLTQEQQRHPSETSMDGIAADYTLLNDGSPELLRRRAADLTAELNGFHKMTLQDVEAHTEDKSRPYDHIWDMYYDEFEDATDNDMRGGERYGSDQEGRTGGQV